MIVVDVKRHVLTRGHARILRAQMLTDIKHIEVQSLCHAFERPGDKSLTFVKLTSRQGDVEVAMKIPVQTRDSGDVNLLLRNRGDNEYLPTGQGQDGPLQGPDEHLLVFLVTWPC